MANTPGKKPGSGRYTTYVPVDSPRNRLLREIFNKRAGDAGTLYGDPDQTDNSAAAESVLKRAKDNSKGISPESGLQKGDPDIFSEGVKLDYTGVVDGVSAPNPDDIEWKKPGDPIGAFMPDVSSPGPGNTEGTQKSDPGITQEEAYQDIKGKPFTSDANTASPQSASKNVSDKASLGNVLEKGTKLFNK